MTNAEKERAEAIALLLAQPDEPCLRRGHQYTTPREPLRDPDLIKRDLGIAYVERRRHEYGHDISCVVSVRKQPLYLLEKRRA